MNRKLNEIAPITLYYFKVIAEEQSMTRAAEKLYKTQPALSAAIRKMESQLGYPLFERVANRLTLTPSGACLLEYINTSLRILEDGFTAAERLSTQTGSITVATTMATARNYIDEYNVRFKKDVQVEIQDTPDIIASVISGRAEIGINFGYVQDVRLSNIPVLRGHYFVCVNAEHPLYNRQSVTLEELSGYQLFCSRLSGTIDKIKSIFRRAGLDCNILTLDEADVLFRAAELGLGAVIVGVYQENTHTQHGRSIDITAIPIMDCQEQPYTVLLTRRDAVLTPESAHLVSYLTEAFATQQKVTDDKLERCGVLQGIPKNM